jgi:hypothetical protein
VAKSKPKNEPKQPSTEAEPAGKAPTYKTLDEFYAANPEALAKWEDDGVVAAVAQTHKSDTPVGKLQRPTTTPRPEKKLVRSSPRKKPSLRKKGK